MISKKYRLKKNYEFRHIYNKGTSAACKIMILYAAKNRDGAIKIGFSVSKKIGKSVIRNRVKRLMREAVRNSLNKFKKGYNYIIVSRNSITESAYLEICSSLLYLLKKVDKIV